MSTLLERAAALSGIVDAGGVDKEVVRSVMELIEALCHTVQSDSLVITSVSTIYLKVVRAEDLELSVMLEIWKLYLPFLKLYYFAMDPLVCAGFLTLLQEATISAVESLRTQFEHARSSNANITINSSSSGGGYIDPKSCGVVNFLCQRISASVSFFVHEMKICDKLAASALGTVALVHAVLTEYEQPEELLNKYHHYFGKALRPPEGGLSQNTQQGMTQLTGTGASSAQSATIDNSGTLVDNSIVLAITSGAISLAFDHDHDISSSTHHDLRGNETKAKSCFAFAWLIMCDLKSTLVSSSSSCSLRLDGARVCAYLEAIVTAAVVVSVRYLGQISDRKVKDLLLGAIDAIASARGIFLHMQSEGDVERIDSFVFSLSCLVESEASVSAVKAEVGRWLLCGCMRRVGEQGEAQLLEAFQRYIGCSLMDLVSRPSDMHALSLACRAILLTVTDKSALNFLLFLKQLDDSTSGGHVKAAIWTQVPLRGLYERKGDFSSAISGLLSSSCAMMAKNVAAATGASEPVDEVAKQRLGLALTILSNYGSSLQQQEARGGGDKENRENITTTTTTELVDLSMPQNRCIATHILKVQGAFCRLLDKLFDPAHKAPSQLSLGKVLGMLQSMHSILGCIVGQRLPPKFLSKLVSLAQTVASLAVRLSALTTTIMTSTTSAATAKSPQQDQELAAECVLRASKYCFMCITICIFPQFREEEFEVMQSIYHSLVKACEVLSREENKASSDLLLPVHSSSSSSSSSSNSSKPRHLRRCGWRTWCLLQQSLAECVASFPPEVLPKARLLIPQLYLPFMAARQQGKTAAIDGSEQCKYDDVYAALLHQEKKEAGEEGKEGGDGQEQGQGQMSLLHAATEHLWGVAVHRGVGELPLFLDNTINKAPLSSPRYLVSHNNDYSHLKRAKTA